MHETTGPVTATPVIGVAAWARAPDAPAITVAFATLDEDRQQALAAAFHTRAQPVAQACRPPAVVVVDEPALLWQQDVAQLRAPHAVVLGAGDDVECAVALLVDGAAALLPADAPAAAVVDAVGCVLRGEAVVPPAVAVAVAERVRAAERDD